MRVTRVAATGAVAFYASGDYAAETGSARGFSSGRQRDSGCGQPVDSAVGVEIGTRAGGTTDPVNGKVYYAEIRSGINGAVGAKFDPRDAALTASTSFASGTGETWTLAGSAAINTTSSSDDRLTRNFYDADGKLRGTLDAEGYLVEYKYVAAGQLSETIGYATPTDPTKRISGTLAQLIATTPTSLDDIHSFALYNAKGQVIGVVDGEGYLTETVYDAAGNKAQSVRYGTRVTFTPGMSIASIRPRAALALPGVTGSFASTPDTAANSVTGDLDLRALIAPTDWTPAALQEIVDKSATDSSQFSYLLRLNPDGTLSLYWSSNGTTLSSVTSTVAVAATDGTAKWVRATLDVDNGAAGRDIKFYTSDDGSAWTPLGAAATLAGTTSVFDGTAALRLGARNNTSDSPFSGRIYYVEVRNGINGTVVAKFNPADAASLSSTSFTSSTGEAWTLAGTAALLGGGPRIRPRRVYALNPARRAPTRTLLYTYDSVGHLTRASSAEHRGSRGSRSTTTSWAPSARTRGVPVPRTRPISGYRTLRTRPTTTTGAGGLATDRTAGRRHYFATRPAQLYRQRVRRSEASHLQRPVAPRRPPRTRLPSRRAAALNAQRGLVNGNKHDGRCDRAASPAPLVPRRKYGRTRRKGSDESHLLPTRTRVR